jgi:hypothetical protein
VFVDDHTPMGKKIRFCFRFAKDASNPVLKRKEWLTRMVDKIILPPAKWCISMFQQATMPAK